MGWCWIDVYLLLNHGIDVSLLLKHGIDVYLLLNHGIDVSLLLNHGIDVYLLLNHGIDVSLLLNHGIDVSLLLNHGIDVYLLLNHPYPWQQESWDLCLLALHPLVLTSKSGLSLTAGICVSYSFTPPGSHVQTPCTPPHWHETLNQRWLNVG